MGKSTKESRRYLNIEIVVGLIGFLMSIILHEAYHLYMHWDHIQHISLFPNPTTIVQVDVLVPPEYDLKSEEAVAYGITLLVAIITVMIIFKIRDVHDKRSTSQILFPKNSEMRKMSPSEMLDLSGLDEFGQPAQLPVRKKSHKSKQSK